MLSKFRKIIWINTKNNFQINNWLNWFCKLKKINIGAWSLHRRSCNHDNSMNSIIKIRCCEHRKMIIWWRRNNNAWIQRKIIETKYNEQCIKIGYQPLNCNKT